jgi:hypothetical protein
MILCLIASHVSTKQRLSWLGECVDSALVNLNPDKVLVSLSSDLDLVFEGPKDTRVEYFFSPTKLYQFDHLLKLSGYVNPEDYVVLMDDDDMFLPSAYDVIRDFVRGGKTGCLGYQIVASEEEDDVNLYTFNDLQDNYLNLMMGFTHAYNWKDRKPFGEGLNMMVQHDTAGSFSLGDEFIKYFENREYYWDLITSEEREGEDITKGEEDLIFGDYQKRSEGYDDSIQIPYVFHRLHALKRDY